MVEKRMMVDHDRNVYDGGMLLYLREDISSAFSLAEIRIEGSFEFKEQRIALYCSYDPLEIPIFYYLQ